MPPPPPPPQLSDDETDDLLYAARTGDDAELALLLARLAAREACPAAEILGAARDAGRSTCLHMACGNGLLETVNLLLSHFNTSTSTNTNTDTNTNSTATAAAAPPHPGLQAFLDAQNEFGNTALHWAALGGSLALVRRLVAAGASPGVANDRNYLPLDLAAQKEWGEVVDFFLAQSGGLEEGNAAGEGEGEGEGKEEGNGHGDGGGTGGMEGGGGLEAAVAQVRLDGVEERGDDEEGLGE